MVRPADLVEAGLPVAIVIVPGEDLEHGGEDGGAHDGRVLAQGVEDPQAVAQGGVGREADLVIIGRRDEGVGDDLVQTEAAADLPYPALAELLGGEAAAGADGTGEAGGNLVIAVEAGNLLGEVGVMLDVGAPAGHGDGAVLDREAELAEDDGHVVGGDLSPEQGVDAIGLEGKDGLVTAGGIDVDDALDHLAGAEELDQLAGALDGAVGVLGVEALLVAGGGVSPHAEGRGRAADGDAVEVGALEEDHGGVADDLAVGAAHDAGNADGLVGIADAEHGGAETALGAVEGLDALPFAGEADMNFAALDAGKVEGVHGLAILEHDVVGDVDEVVDGPHAGVADALAHPGGRRGDLHVSHHAGGVAAAERGLLDDDAGEGADIAAGLGTDLGLVQAEGLVKGHGGLARQTDHAQAVRAVGGNLELDDVVIAADEGGDIVSGHGGLMDDEDAVGDAVGKLLLLRVQVLEGEDGLGFGAPGDEIALVEVIVGGREGEAGIAAEVELHPETALRRGDGEDAGRDDGLEDIVAGGDVGGDGGPGLVQGMVVREDGGRADDGIGVVMGGELELLQGAEHALGEDAAELAGMDLGTGREQGAVEGHGDQIARVDVPGAGDNRHGGVGANVNGADVHVVGVGVAGNGEDAADLHIAKGGGEVLGHLHLGAGDSHRLGKGAVAVFTQGQVDEVVEPFSGQFHLSRTSLKLLEEAHIILENEAQVGDLVLAHREALESHAEGPAGVDVRVDAAAGENLGVHHAGAEDLDPALTLAGRAAAAAALVALDVELAARLGEGEMMRAETGHGPLAVDLLHHQVQRRLEVGHGDALVDDHALDLVEHGRVRGVHLVLAVDAAGGDHADGQVLRLHGVDLHGRGLGAKENAAVVGEVEGVRPLARGVTLVDVQLREVVVGQLHLGAVDDLKAHADEDVLDLVEDVVHRVLVPDDRALARQGDVHRLLQELHLELRLRQGGAALVDAALDLRAQLVRQLPHRRAFVRREPRDLAKNARQFTFFAEVLHAQGLERVDILALKDRPQRGLAQLLHHFFHCDLLKIKISLRPAQQAQ